MNTITLTEHQKQYINPNAKLWLETLKFGELPQTISVLQDDTGYCCLGVACKVAQEQDSNLIPDFLLEEDENDFYFSGESLTSELAQHYGLHCSYAGFDPCVVMGMEADRAEEIKELKVYDLPRLNDQLGWTFPQIADFCLEHCEHVFVKIGD